MAAAAEPEGLTPLLARILRNIGDAESQRQLGHGSSASARPRSRWRRANWSAASSSSARPTRRTIASPSAADGQGRAAVADIEARTAASSPVAQALDEKQMRSLLKSSSASTP